jgi:hypothetical protein
MIALVCFIWAVLVSPFKSKSGLAAENAALRQQLTALEAKGGWSRRVSQTAFTARGAVSAGMPRRRLHRFRCLLSSQCLA